MIDHISIGVGDVLRTKAFYTAALEPLGYSLLSEGEDSFGYGGKQAQFWANKADRPVAPDPESGLHICFVAPTRESLDAFYDAALASCGHDNGGPGLRPDYGPDYYAAFAIDPDGYRISRRTAAGRNETSFRLQV